MTENYGIKISKATKNITSIDPDDYHFWSKYRAKSVKYQGTLNVTTNTGVDSSPATNTYTHNFGYIPQFMVFTTSAIDGEYYNIPFGITTSYGKSGEMQTETISAYVTSTEIVVSADWNYYVPMSGTHTGRENTYTFDILLFMEEIETS